MAGKSKIEWTDASYTPIRARNVKTGKIGWHCEHATTGCEFCYAETLNKRLGTGLPFKPGHRSDIEIFLDNKMLLAPLHWKKPRMIFVCSMTDIFADFVPDEWIDKVFAVMALCPQHTFQVLTKRAERMREYFLNDRQNVVAWEPIAAVMKLWCPDWASEEINGPHRRLAIAAGTTWPLPNVWLGVSTERQKEADERIPLLLQTPAAVRFISAEPLLGPISLHALNLATPRPSDALRGVQCEPDDGPDGYRNVPMNKLDWVIVGGESGRNARPMHVGWARDLRDWCQATNVPFFFKQHGEWHPRVGKSGLAPHVMAIDGTISNGDELKGGPEHRPRWIAIEKVGKKAAGRLLDGITHDEMPSPSEPARRAGGG